ncbi:MAG: metallophosphoesterase family protein [Jatrophihabitantaceae bacterium]
MPSVSPAQAELPLEGLPSNRRLARLRARLDEADRTLRKKPAAAARAAVEFVLRWAMRIGFPLAGAAAMLHLFPYHAQAGGVHFQVQATLLTRSGITADTTFGSWIFSNVDGLPVGVHISPENVDVVRMAASATSDPTAYVAKLREDFSDQVPRVAAWLVGEALIGVLIGLAIAAAVNLAIRYLRQVERVPGELRRRVKQLGAAAAVMAVLAGYGALSYDPDWAKRSRLTGTLGALQLFPGQLKEYYQQRATAFDVVSGIASIQAQLQHNIDQTAAPATEFNIMYISDMHLGSTYPLVRQYAKNFSISLIVNTGDESQFGTAAELTPEYRSQIRAVTKVAPMIWLAGNHDSPTTEQIMRKIPGVIVMGTKTANADGFAVAAEQLDAFGLHIGAVADPRVYGAAGRYGSNDETQTHSLERSAVDQALKGVPGDAYFDVFATHEPVAAAQIVKDLPGRVRQTNSGHLHKQNADHDIQSGEAINLVEGSTGAGGLKEVGIDVTPTPIEFSIESVAADCQFTKVIRFQVTGAAPESASTVGSGGQNVTAETLYLKKQKIKDGRQCTTAQGIGAVTPVS